MTADLSYSRAERGVAERAKDWATRRGFAFASVARTRREAAPFPPDDHKIADYTAAAAATRSQRTEAAMRSFRADLTADLNAFNVMAGRYGELVVTVEQYGATGGLPTLADREGKLITWDTRPMHTVKTGLRRSSPYFACGPSKIIRPWAQDLPSAPLVAVEGVVLPRRHAVCSVDQGFAARLFAAPAAAELVRLPVFAESALVVRDAHCHVLATGPVDAEVLDARLALLGHFLRLLPSALR